MSSEDKIAYFGLTDYRNKKTKFGIKNSDRSRHVYIIGKTGMGKSTLLENMAAQDILNGEGMCFVDPHGSAIDTLMEYIPENRVTDVVYFAPFDTEFPISFNVLEDVSPDQRHLVMAGLMASFKKIWPDSFSARMEYILANTLLALLEYPNATLLGVNRMLAEKDYRDEIISKVTDSSVKAFWIDEYNKWDPRYAREAGAAIQNKIGQFTSNPLIRNIIGQEKTSFNLREVMDNKKILLVNLSKGRIGEANSNLLGGMLITKLYLAAMSRADVGARGIDALPHFFFFVDEFQNFANESFADILAEARKYKLNLTVAHQYVDQMEEKVAAAIFGNVGTMITFRIGATDAEVFEKQFLPTFTAEDIVNLGKFQIYLSLMIDGIGSRPFSAATLPPIPIAENSMREHVIANSRYWFTQERHVVERDVEKWYEPVRKPVKMRITDPKDIKTKNESADARVFKAPSKNNQQSSNTNNSNNKIFDNKKNDEKLRDFASPLKKALKEVDQKEAEIEMKKIISPKLNSLLDNFDNFTSKNPKIGHVVDNIKKKDNFSNKTKNEVSDSVKEKEARLSMSQQQAAQTPKQQNNRSAQTGTKSSLSDILAKALNNKKTETKAKQDQNVSNTKVETPTSSKTINLKDSSISNNGKPYESTTKAKQEKDSFVHPDYQYKPTQTPTKKEIPEDILKKILE